MFLHEIPPRANSKKEAAVSRLEYQTLRTEVNSISKVFAEIIEGQDWSEDNLKKVFQAQNRVNKKLKELEFDVAEIKGDDGSEPNGEEKSSNSDDEMEEDRNEDTNV